MFQSADTPQYIKKIQEKIWLSKTLEERLYQSLKMCEDAQELQKAGIRHAHPTWSEDQIKLEMLRRKQKNDPSLWWLDKINIWK
jgi:hypothetical protein